MMVSFMAKPQQPQQGQDVPPMMKALLKMPGVGQGVSQIFAIIQAVDMQLKQQNEMLKVLLTVAAEQRDAIARLSARQSELHGSDQDKIGVNTISSEGAQ